MPWGLFVENIFIKGTSILIKDVILSPEVQQNLQSAAIQKRVSEATIISAKADVESAKMMKETSDILSSGSAMQIRYLETIQTMLAKTPNKTMFVSLKGQAWLFSDRILVNLMEHCHFGKPEVDTASSGFFLNDLEFYSNDDR